MPLEPRDAAYLWDMVETGKAVSAFTSGVKPHEYLADRKLQMAVERAVEIVGEAARRVSDSFKADHSEIPWRQGHASRVRRFQMRAEDVPKTTGITETHRWVMLVLNDLGRVDPPTSGRGFRGRADRRG